MKNILGAPKISVVIIGKNEGERLIRCIKSVQEMSSHGGEVQVIYVDTASSDGSPQHAADLGAQVICLQPVRPCAAVARNAGWSLATGPLVLFLDGDTILHPDFVVNVLPLFNDESVAVVCGQRREIDLESSVFNRVLDLDWVNPAGPTDYCGGDAIIRKAVLDEVEGYDESLIAGEEPDMCRRMREKGYVIQQVDRPMTGHDLAIHRWGQYWRRATRTGHAYAEVSERYRNTPLPLWARESRQNVIRGLGLLLLGPTGLMAAILWPSGAFALAVVGIYGVLVLRSAYKFRWKGADLVTMLLYGVHSHLQQIPILFGQLTYWKKRLAGDRQSLIEYKEVST
jgi:cellulose synthase/poly-beta-1,6-N-acetylglucosamine synthase-like glycosyltransferase